MNINTSGGVHNFPAPFPNEHILSCLMRYAHTQGRREYMKVVKPISSNVSNIGNDCYWRPIYTDVLNQFHPDFHFEIAKRKTLLNVFAMFSGATFHSLLASLLHNPTKLQFRNSKIVNVMKGWKWCPQCVLQDEKSFGFPYWHVDHQFSLKHLCSEHGTPLLACCPNCGYEYSSILQGPPPYDKCVYCGKKIESEARYSTELDDWLEGNANLILANRLEVDFSGLKKQICERFGFSRAKRSWSVAERKQLKNQQDAFYNWLKSLNLSNQLAVLKGSRLNLSHRVFNLTSFAFGEQALPPLVVLLISRYLEETEC